MKNNSLFGKTMENVRGRMEMRLCQTARKLRTYSSKPLFQSCKVFGTNLVGVQLLKEEVSETSIGQYIKTQYIKIDFMFRYYWISLYISGKPSSIFQSWSCISFVTNTWPITESVSKGPLRSLVAILIAFSSKFEEFRYPISSQL